MPEYDGRGGRPTTPGRALLWVPRVALFPAYVVSEYVIRRPLGFVITAAERNNVPFLLYDFFTFGPGRTAGVVPIAFVEYGFAPSIGFYAFWDDAGMPGHDLRLRASTGGTEWLAAAFSERFQLGKALNFSIGGGLSKRPDYAFYGTGGFSDEDDLGRYGARKAYARSSLRFDFWQTSALDLGIGYRGVSFYEGDFRGKTTVEERVEQGRYPLPSGYRDGYRAPSWGLSMVLDTRDRPALSQSGLRLVLRGEQGVDLANEPSSSFVRYGATLGGFWDLADSARVVSLSVDTQMADPLGDRPVPFTELVALGGASQMPGFREGRLLGRSSAVGTLRYSWPIWIWLDGSLQAAVGNVFEERLQGFSLDDSRFSGAIGIESRGSLDSVFQLLVGFGTDTFADGAQINSIRIAAGARNGF